jgi:hypothetical protein
MANKTFGIKVKTSDVQGQENDVFELESIEGVLTGETISAVNGMSTIRLNDVESLVVVNVTTAVEGGDGG